MSTFDEQAPTGDGESRPTEPVPDLAELEKEVARTRAELGGTVDALSARLDVPTRAKGRVDASREKARRATLRAREAVIDEQGRPVPAAWLGAGTALAAAVGLALLVRARR